MKNPITHLNEQIDIYDIFILGLTGLSILTIVVLAIPTFDSNAKQIALTLDLIISFLFMIDFFYILVTAEDKKEYLKWGWLDFLGSLPFIPLLRILRIFRAIRSLRILRHNNLQELFQVITKRPERTTVFSVLLFTIILVGLSSYTIYRTELSSPSRNILNMSDALWWAIVTITTVGYGDHFPTTNGGRTIAIVLMFTGIGIFGALTSYLSTLFINRRNKNIEVNNQQINERLARIEEQLRNLTIEKENQCDKSDESSP